MALPEKDLHDNEIKIRLTDAQLAALMAEAALIDVPIAVKARMFIVRALKERKALPE